MYIKHVINVTHNPELFHMILADIHICWSSPRMMRELETRKAFISQQYGKTKKCIEVEKREQYKEFFQRIADKL